MGDFPVSGQEPAFRWGRPDLLAFASFFLATVLLLPTGVFIFLRLARPGLQIENLSGVEQILIQAVLDLALVGFILFLVKLLHGRPILRTLHWIWKTDLRPSYLISGGAFMALTVLLLSSFFPQPSNSPLEKLLTTTASIVAFVVFGITIAPLLEEIIFRGFLFTVLEDVYGTGVAIPLTALLFAGLHLTQLRGNWPAVVMIFLVGYVLTIVRHRSNSVIPSVIMHTAYNAMIFGVSALPTVLGPAPGGSFDAAQFTYRS